MIRRGDLVAVYCGSRDGTDPIYQRVAYEMGGELARHDLGIVTGGSSVGLMRRLADGALANGGRVIGVRPHRVFPGEPAHDGISEMYETSSLHERKNRMSDMATAYLGLPGGIGTLDEIVELMSWAYLGMHTKPVLLLDVCHFWTPLTTFVTDAVATGLADASLQTVFAIYDSPQSVIRALLPGSDA